MRRTVFLMLLAAGAMLGAAWLASSPGVASLELAGWRLDTSAGGLLALVALIAFVLVLMDRLWRAVMGAPKRFRLWRQARRERHGYAALTRGLVAIAAGDGREARRQAQIADRALGAAPIARLLSAQAAQLAGDEKGARLHLEAMRAEPETEFVALRGLVAAAIKAGDSAEALVLARRAREIKADAPWVSAALIDLETKAGEWAAAAETLTRARRANLIDPALADAQTAAALLESARTLEIQGQRRAAIAAAERALRLAPDRPELVAFLATLYARDGRARAAGNLIEKEWARMPHPDLLAAYRLARPVANALQWVKQLERLTKTAPDHRQTHRALAEAALAAELWGEAKRHGEAALAAGDGVASIGLCRWMAQLAEAAGEAPASVQHWLAKAATAMPDPVWSCSACGQPHVGWQALCSHCGAFDRLEWRAPARLADGPAQLEGPRVN